MVVRQFLLKPDGSVPDGVDVAALHAQGIPLVVPTPRWRPADGFELREAEPTQHPDGTWHQTWIEVPVPVSEVPVPEVEVPLPQVEVPEVPEVPEEPQHDEPQP